MQRPAAIVKTAASPALAAGARATGRWLLDQLYPPACLACGVPVENADTLCAACFRHLRPITAPLCPRLGIPFAASVGPEALSAEAIADPPPFARARAALVYNDLAGRLVSRLKYGDKPELARFCARLMAPAGREFWGAAPILVPVPLHRRRLLKRRYNQSLELGRALARLTGLELAPGLVVRTRPTRQQVGLSGDQRRRNVSGAFAVPPAAMRRHAGRRIVLIDDVLTTGSTVRAITHALRRQGFDHIDILTFARVVIGDDLPI